MGRRNHRNFRGAGFGRSLGGRRSETGRTLPAQIGPLRPHFVTTRPNGRLGRPGTSKKRTAPAASRRIGVSSLSQPKARCCGMPQWSPGQGGRSQHERPAGTFDNFVKIYYLARRTVLGRFWLRAAFDAARSENGARWRGSVDGEGREAGYDDRRRAEGPRKGVVKKWARFFVSRYASFGACVASRECAKAYVIVEERKPLFSPPLLAVVLQSNCIWPAVNASGLTGGCGGGPFEEKGVSVAETFRSKRRLWPNAREAKSALSTASHRPI